MRYCKRCVLPDTRPGLEIGPDEICSGCAGHADKLRLIDWNKRKKKFESLVSEVKIRQGGYDCIVPVSGGKDSTWQVVKCLEYGLKILAVTWKTPGRTVLGQKNLDNLVQLGVDHIDYTINPEVERRFMYKTLVKAGDTAVPMHMALYAIPLKIAVSLQVPLVIWGENPHMEYGGSEDDRARNILDMDWLKRHGILQGTFVDDWIDKDLTCKDLEAYRLPENSELQAQRIISFFLGYYFPWDPEESCRIAVQHGFQTRLEGPKTGYYNYADIDCDFISVHHHFKWLKFGFTRLFDNLAVEIRNGRLSRENALQIIAERGDQTPHEDIERICRFLRITLKTYHEIEDKFRNRRIWSYENGVWKIHDFIIKDWKWQ